MGNPANACDQPPPSSCRYPSAPSETARTARQGQLGRGEPAQRGSRWSRRTIRPLLSRLGNRRSPAHLFRRAWQLLLWLGLFLSSMYIVGLTQRPLWLNSPPGPQAYARNPISPTPSACQRQSYQLRAILGRLHRLKLCSPASRAGRLCEVARQAHEPLGLDLCCHRCGSTVEGGVRARRAAAQMRHHRPSSPRRAGGGGGGGRPRIPTYPVDI